MRRSLLFLLVVCASAPGAVARGGEPPGGVEEPIPPPPPPPEPPPPGATPAAEPEHATTTVTPLPPPPPSEAERKAAEHEEGWIDVGHAFIEHRIFAPVLRIDRFFSDERDLEAERARSFIRWRNGIHFTEGSYKPDLATSLSATLRLPGLNKQLQRLRVEITGESRDTVISPFPGETALGEAGPPEGTLRTAGAGLRYRIFETLTTHADLGGGMLLQLPPGVYGRVRFRFVEPLGQRFLARQALTPFYRTDTGFGTTTSAEVERPLAQAALARLAGTGTIHERSRGFEWIADLSLLATVRGRLGAQIGAAMNGATDAPTAVDKYRVYTRLRRDFYRKWLFFELEPEYAWPWKPDVGRQSLWGVTFRLEVQFQGNEPPPPEPPPPPDPEPADPVTDALQVRPEAG